MSPKAIARRALILCLIPFLTAQAPAPRSDTLSSGNPPAPAASYSGNEMSYRGFSVDMALVADQPNRAAIEASLKKQLDIVADCGAKPEVLAFFRSQRIKLKHGGEDGGGRFSSAGIEIDAAPEPPEKPIVLHEMLHAMHARYIPNGANNPDIIRFYNNAVISHAYPDGEYVLKNKSEFFAVTGSLYLWGYVARPPNNRETLRAKQPYYYEWLGELFGVKK
jgi:hypothetical protein